MFFLKYFSKEKSNIFGFGVTSVTYLRGGLHDIKPASSKTVIIAKLSS